MNPQLYFLENMGILTMEILSAQWALELYKL